MSAEALLDTLLPGDGDFPSGGRIAIALAAHPRFSGPLNAILASLPSDFEVLDSTNRTTAVQTAETAKPDTFSALIVGIYSLYYTDPTVAKVIGKLTGHSVAPPQPHGHALSPFDPAMVAIPAARAPHYRPTPKAPS